MGSDRRTAQSHKRKGAGHEGDGDGVRGSGAGRRLLDAAMAFVDEKDFAETHLWTFGGLSAAQHLYESYGFECVEERPGSQWGREVIEQRFVRRDR